MNGQHANSCEECSVLEQMHSPFSFLQKIVFIK
jgi:hypothetical protein